MKLNVLISYGEPPRARSHIHTQVASCIIRSRGNMFAGNSQHVQHASRIVPIPLFMYNRAMRRSSIRCNSVMLDNLSDWIREISFWQIPTQRCLVLMGGIMSDTHTHTHTHSITNFHVSFERFALNLTFIYFSIWQQQQQFILARIMCSCVSECMCLPLLHNSIHYSSFIRSFRNCLMLFVCCTLHACTMYTFIAHMCLSSFMCWAHLHRHFIYFWVVTWEENFSSIFFIPPAKLVRDGIFSIFQGNRDWAADRERERAANERTELGKGQYYYYRLPGAWEIQLER